MRLKQIVGILIFCLMFVRSNGQTDNVIRTYRQTDSCLFLLSIPNTFLYLGDSLQRIYLLDRFHCIKNEQLILRKGITWLSFPRHLRPDDPEFTPTPNVLAQSNISGGYSKLKLNYFNSQSNQTVYAQWGYSSPPIWQYYPDNFMQNINSTRGYKFELLPNEEKILFLNGMVENPNTSMHLYGNGIENWMGYWLYLEQSPFDAIPNNVLDHLTNIKAQDWFCFKDWSMGQQYPSWICGVKLGKTPGLKYGDMVILKSNTDINFQWQNSGSISGKEVKSATEYYQYTETTDYVPFIIELDSTDKPSEIGAFIGDSCIGATTVLPSDTIVLIPGYADTTGGEVTFSEHYEGNKSAKPKITKYFVKEYQSDYWSKRTIDIGEKRDYYFVSFKNKVIHNRQDNLSGIHIIKIYPNPSAGKINLDYLLDKPCSITFTLYDVTGRKVAEVRENKKPSGRYSFVWNLTDNKGHRVKNGLYLFKVSSGVQSITKQIIIKR